MLRYTVKDITTVTTGIVAHGVNCQHKMASGVAKAIRQKWPIVYDRYMSNPKGSTMLGLAHIIRVDDTTDLHVANVYTQIFYGYGGGRYADIRAVENGMGFVASTAEAYNINVYMPRIGCGLGGLDWDTEVGPAMLRVANTFPRIDIVVCDLPTVTQENINEFVNY